MAITVETFVRFSAGEMNDPSSLRRQGGSGGEPVTAARASAGLSAAGRLQPHHRRERVCDSTCGAIGVSRNGPAE